MRRSARAWLALTTAASIAACSSGAESVDCPAGSLLRGDVCATTCSREEECVRGERCIDGACVIPSITEDGGGNTFPDAMTFPDAGFRDASEPIDLGVIECARNEDCGPRIEGDWSECHDFDDFCDESGIKVRTISTPYCNPENKCAIEESQDMDLCRRPPTNGQECAPVEIPPFGECKYEEECSETGLQSREIVIHKCDREQCVPNKREETMPCERNTQDQPCAPFTVDLPLSDCQPVIECGSDGQQTQTTEHYACHQQQCVVAFTSEQMFSCPAQVDDGTPCGTDGMSQCCSNLCEARNSPFNCGVCGVFCDQNENRTCEPVINPTDPNNAAYACSCRGNDECLSYGPGECIGDLAITEGACRCDCGMAASPCSGPCAGGLCYDPSPGFGPASGVCAYP